MRLGHKRHRKGRREGEKGRDRIQDYYYADLEWWGWTAVMMMIDAIMLLLEENIADNNDSGDGL